MEPLGLGLAENTAGGHRTTGMGGRSTAALRPARAAAATSPRVLCRLNQVLAASLLLLRRGGAPEGALGNPGMRLHHPPETAHPSHPDMGVGGVKTSGELALETRFPTNTNAARQAVMSGVRTDEIRCPLLPPPAPETGERPWTFDFSLTPGLPFRVAGAATGTR